MLYVLCRYSRLSFGFKQYNFHLGFVRDDVNNTFVVIERAQWRTWGTAKPGMVGDH